MEHAGAHVLGTGITLCTPQPMVKGSTGQLKLDNITVDWQRATKALQNPTNIHLGEMRVDGKEVGAAREIVARTILESPDKAEFLFFLDNDVIAPSDAITKLFFRARCFPDHDIFCGVYTCKWSNPPEPLIYKGNGNGAFWDWSVGDILTTDGHGISACHMGLTLIRVNLFQRMLEKGLGKENLFFKTETETREYENGMLKSKRGTEDIYFCNKVMAFGGKIMVDTSVLAGHIDKNTGITYGLPYDGPVSRAKWMADSDGKPRDDQPDLKKALDLGAGTYRREWEGHKTYTTDIRPDVGADYVQDTRQLNIPDNHFDLVASSHHLEHLGRFDQESVWSEIFRVTKPGGLIEHIVPNVEWAADQIGKGVVDESVYNVLYGAQEAHGYKREFNLHYFGYTPAVSKSLAENAGFVDVETRDYKDDPDLGYNLLITGRKPNPDQVVRKRTKKPKLIKKTKKVPRKKTKRK